MKRIIIGAGIAIMLSLSFTASAQEDTCVASDKKVTDIYYANGVGTDWKDVLSTGFVLEKAYMQSLKNEYVDQEFKFSVAYNRSEGLLNDLQEVFIQKFNELDSVTTLTPTSAFYLFRTSAKATELGLTASDTEGVVEAIATTLATHLADSIKQEETTADILIQKLRSSLQEGSRVLLIAHSQGNLFANTALESLIAEDAAYANSIGMIGVATPAAVTYNNSPYWTAHDDLVIDGLRLVTTSSGLPAPLASNVDNGPGDIDDDTRDLLKHEFLPSYFLGDLASRDKIDNDFFHYMTTLEFPGNALLGSGPLVFTLTWGAEPDVDLHVYEPNGTHVYYSDMVGISGYLDLDDVTSYGPEHYYVACATLETGEYRVGVNYFEGSGPETAQVQITTGDGNTRSFSQPLTTAVSFSGDNVPIPVATVTVTQDSNGQYTFTVRAD